MIALLLLACAGTDDETADTSPPTGCSGYLDEDGDGYGVPTDDCDPSPSAEQGGDCDDADPAVHPFAIEVCDRIDNDCDGLIDSRDQNVQNEPLIFLDSDGDGYGTDGVRTCADLSTHVEFGGDCNDDNPAVNPDAVEVCGDGVDNNCNEVTDEDCP